MSAAWDKYAKANPTFTKTKPILRRGCRGEAVRELQERLNYLGYSCGVVDGIFGDDTKDAVKAFQAEHGLAVDGVAGAKTWNELNR